MSITREGTKARADALKDIRSMAAALRRSVGGTYADRLEAAADALAAVPPPSPADAIVLDKLRGDVGEALIMNGPVEDWPQDQLDNATEAILRLFAAARTPPSAEGTAAATWRADGKSDPHGSRYDCERAKLMMGDLTDDEIANAVFLYGNAPFDLKGIMDGTAKAPIAYLTAAKDRIRWLSRSLVAAEAREAMMREALLLAEGRIGMLMRTELPGSDHPAATRWVLDKILATLSTTKEG